MSSDAEADESSTGNDTDATEIYEPPTDVILDAMPTSTEDPLPPTLLRKGTLIIKKLTLYKPKKERPVPK